MSQSKYSVFFKNTAFRSGRKNRSGQLPFLHFSIKTTALFAFILIFLAACTNSDYYPKPRGFFRIDLPAKTYQPFDSIFPYTFRYSTAAAITFDRYTDQNKYWLNLDYPDYKARIHISYKNLDNYPLYQLTEDARSLAYKHAPMAIGIQESDYANPEHQVFGHAYRILGRDAASPYQFYLSDSSRHFLRGALYFNISPNNDSLQPVIDHIIDDIDYLIQSFRWQEVK